MKTYRYVQKCKVNNNKQKYLQQTPKIAKLQFTKLEVITDAKQTSNILSHTYTCAHNSWWRVHSWVTAKEYHSHLLIAFMSYIIACYQVITRTTVTTNENINFKSDTGRSICVKIVFRREVTNLELIKKTGKPFPADTQWCIKLFSYKWY